MLVAKTNQILELDFLFKQSIVQEWGSILILLYFIFILKCVYVCVYVCVCIYVCMYV